MRFLIIFIFLITNVVAGELPGIKNIVIHKVPKTYDNVIFLDKKDQKININEYKGKLLLLNFWATWCAPCKKEMPSLDLLQTHKSLNNLKIFPINVGRDNFENASNFFKELDIQNLKLYFDSSQTLANKFYLRGLPTSILFNKDGLEFARIIGSIDFEDKKFIEWLSNYN